MIEIVYNKEKESAVGNEEYFCVPRNIRQVGQPSSNCKIYIEDCVYSYLKHIWKESQDKAQMAILLGKSNWKGGIFYIFLKSAILIEQAELSEDYITIKDEIWGSIYEEMKEFFPGQEVVGWHLALPSGALKITEVMKRIHLNHFGGNDKVLYLTDLSELDNAFFIYRNSRMEKQTGYYIFYEKNEEMQEYVLEKHPKTSVDYTGKPQDRAVQDFRKIIERKRKERESKRWDGTLGLLTAGAAVVVAVLGVMWLQQNITEQSVTEENTVEHMMADSDVVEESMIEESVIDQIGEEQNEMEDMTNQNEADLNVPEELTEQGEAKLNMPEELTEQFVLENEAGSADSERITDSESVVSSTNSHRYTICAGDTLSSISIRYYGNMQKIDEICRMNGLEEADLIYPGQEIILP